MSVVNDLTSAQAASQAARNQASAAASASDDMGFDTFLTLLTAQLKYQDPMNPMEGTEFTNQIATFSQLEQQMQSNSHLEALTEQADYSAQAMAVSYIGKEALAADAKLTVDADGESVEFAYDLSEKATKVIIEVFDKEGNKMKEFVPSGTSEGVHKLTWDGTDLDDEAVPAGEYTVKISSYNSDAEKVVTTLMTYGEVVGVESNGGSPIVILDDDRSIEFTDVAYVREV